MRWGTRKFKDTDEVLAMHVARKAGLGAFAVTMAGHGTMVVAAESHKGAAAHAINRAHELVGAWVVAESVDLITE